MPKSLTDMQVGDAVDRSAKALYHGTSRTQFRA